MTRFVLALMGFFFVGICQAGTYSATAHWRYVTNGTVYATALDAATASYNAATPQAGYSKVSGPYVAGTSCSGTDFVSGSGVSYLAKWNASGATSCWNSSGPLAVDYSCANGGTLSGNVCTKSCNAGECEFRRKLDSDSSRSWTVIPRQAGQ